MNDIVNYFNFDVEYERKPRCVLVGNFDGVHTGHQKLFHEAVKIAKHSNLTLACLTFEPHTRQFFDHTIKRYNIFDFPDKYKKLADAGFQEIYVVHNDAKFFHLSPEEFIFIVLIAKLNCKSIIVGDDFRFGLNRVGDVNLLIEHKQWFSTHMIEKFKGADNQVISSTRIKQALSNGDIPLANKMLGYNYYIKGTIIKQQKISNSVSKVTIKINPVFQIKMGVYECLVEYNLNISKVPVQVTSSLELDVNLTDFNFDPNHSEIILFPFKP
jgi:riboflavin kinase/FMN adenylyltransferase